MSRLTKKEGKGNDCNIQLIVTTHIEENEMVYSLILESDYTAEQ